MSEAARTMRLRIELPEQWDLVDVDLEQLGSSAVAGAALTSASRFVRDPAHRPELIASLFEVVGDESEGFAGIVIGGLAVYSYVSASLPDDFTARLGPRTLHGLELAAGVPADFYERMFAVRSADQGVTALLTFTTPNLTLIPEMDKMFESIAKTVSFGMPNTT